MALLIGGPLFQLENLYRQYGVAMVALSTLIGKCFLWRFPFIPEQELDFYLNKSLYITAATAQQHDYISLYTITYNFFCIFFSARQSPGRQKSILTKQHE